MYHFYIDDSKITSKKHNREKIGNLIAVGGLILADDKIKSLEDDIHTICNQAAYNIPDDENIKWSPNKYSWLRTKIVDRNIRNELYGELLECAAKHSAKAIVAVCDLGCKTANAQASNHEIDATLLALERFHSWLGGNHGMVFVSKPSGGSTNEQKFVSECIEHMNKGTNYVAFENIVSNPMTSPAKHSRLLQLADLVVSITNARVAGGDRYADPLFAKVLAMMPETRRGMKGGLGLKLHPSLKYRNLYHWILGDEQFVEGAVGTYLPISDKPYAIDEMRWRDQKKTLLPVSPGSARTSPMGRALRTHPEVQALP